jgi:hypothetical protein
MNTNNLTETDWRRLVSIVRGAVPEADKGTFSDRPNREWLKKLPPEVQRQFNEHLYRVIDVDPNVPPPDAIEYAREAFGAAIAEVGGFNEPRYQHFRRPTAAEREKRFQLEAENERLRAELKRAKSGQSTLAAERDAATRERDALKRRGLFARLWNKGAQ